MISLWAPGWFSFHLRPPLKGIQDILETVVNVMHSESPAAREVQLNIDSDRVLPFETLQTYP